MGQIAHSLRAAAVGVFLLAPPAFTGCARPPQKQVWRQAQIERGARVIDRFACGSCHEIPGIPAADGRVGPPLGGLSDRTVVAGRLANTPENLAAFLLAPQAVIEDGAMPNMGLTKSEAADATAYLLSRR